MSGSKSIQNLIFPSTSSYSQFIDELIKYWIANNEQTQVNRKGSNLYSTSIRTSSFALKTSYYTQ